MQLTLEGIYELMLSGEEVRLPTPDKVTSERIRLQLVSCKGRMERFNAVLGLDVKVLQADYNADLKLTVFRLSDKRRLRTATPTLFTILPNDTPELDG